MVSIARFKDEKQITWFGQRSLTAHNEKKKDKISSDYIGLITLGKTEVRLKTFIRKRLKKAPHRKRFERGTSHAKRQDAIDLLEKYKVQAEETSKTETLP